MNSDHNKLMVRQSANKRWRQGGAAQIILSAVAVGPIALACLVAGSPPQSKSVAKTPDFLKTTLLPFLTKYCTTCHSGSAAPMGLLLGNIKSEANLLNRRTDFEKVASRIQSHQMPPAGAKAPTQKERDAFIAALQSVFEKAPAPVGDPGRPTLRRLNRAEYDNTIHDLFGIEFAPAEDFPSDDVGYGFDNIGDVLSISPLLMEKYLDAAERIVEKVLPPSKAKTYRYDAGTLQTDKASDVENALMLFTNGIVFAEPVIEKAGSYKIRVLAYGQQAGPEPCKMELRVDGKPQTTFEVRATGSPQAYEIPPIELSQGKHRFAAAFINDYYNPSDPNPGNRDRNLLISAIEIRGPANAESPDSFARKRLMIAVPDPKDPMPAAKTILSSFLRRAFRRSVDQAEVDKYAGLVDAALREKQPFESAIKIAVEAALVSPNFLFRVELDPPTAPGSKARSRILNDFELASRLSYFLWSSMPDDELLGVAETGQLHEAGILQAQLARMLKDPKSNALTENFAAQWLNLRKLDKASPDSEMFSEWSEQLRQDMRKETEAFFEDIVKNDKSVAEFLSANYTFVNSRLAKYYGLGTIVGNDFIKVQLTDGRRGGILTQASLLTLTSNPNRTSPVKRGKWVLENIIGDPPPPPPPGVDALPEDKVKIPSATIKDRLRQHRLKQECAVCHARMDPIGFALENFDAVGKWRTQDGKFPVDATEVLPDGSKLNGPEGLRTYLLKKKDQFVRTLADRLLTYALGRGLEPADKPALDRITAQTIKNGYKFSSLISSVVQSDPFLKRRVN